jgi:hypothetical protein
MTLTEEQLGSSQARTPERFADVTVQLSYHCECCGAPTRATVRSQIESVQDGFGRAIDKAMRAALDTLQYCDACDVEGHYPGSRQTRLAHGNNIALSERTQRIEAARHNETAEPGRPMRAHAAPLVPETEAVASEEDKEQEQEGQENVQVGEANLGAEGDQPPTRSRRRQGETGIDDPLGDVP